MSQSTPSQKALILLQAFLASTTQGVSADTNIPAQHVQGVMTSPWAVMVRNGKYACSGSDLCLRVLMAGPNILNACQLLHYA
ncbi:hypothetical protein DY245_32780 [Streptomyces inhibens]|uniref:Uncharacterized protein n=1 Tax=Streptomyces inhibens TaxID=2293571 RepID=A0A371PVC4_STRIH|nr:hypothetical protein DY245_32780 [Streptomyces inhibens]